jgi:hypothetical protein
MSLEQHPHSVGVNLFVTSMLHSRPLCSLTNTTLSLVAKGLLTGDQGLGLAVLRSRACALASRVCEESHKRRAINAGIIIDEDVRRGLPLACCLTLDLIILWVLWSGKLLGCIFAHSCRFAQSGQPAAVGCTYFVQRACNATFPLAR